MKRLPHAGRWFLAALILFVIVGLAYIWGYADIQRQDQHLRSLLILFLAFAGFLIWIMAASGWAARYRLIVLGLTLCGVLFCAATLRIRGVTGDFIPIVEWRWKGRHYSELLARPASITDSASQTFTNSFPQFLGPNRIGILDGPNLFTNWTARQPRELWRRPVGPAWSGFAVEGSRAITQEQRGDEEFIVCYGTLTGEPIWSHSDWARYATTIAGEGPRATPTISSNRVFTMGGTGILNCLDLATGKLIWTHDTIKEHAAEIPEWGVACSPLIIDRAVTVTVGGAGAAMVAYERESGALLWKSGNDLPHWSTPTVGTLHGTRQIVVFSENVSAYDEQTGKLLWNYPWPSPYPHVTTPLVLSSNRVLVSQGYGGGSELLQVDHDKGRWKAVRIWKSIRLKSKFANLIYLDGHIYGLDDGALVCIAADTGELKWKGDRNGHGQLLLVGRLLLLTSESGEIVLIDPSPVEARECARFKVLNGKTWNPPALAGDILLVRNDREAACLKLPTSQ